MQSSKIAKDIENVFNISLSEIRKFIGDFHYEMKKGLSGEKSSLRMLPTYVKRPEGTETGDFLGLDLGGTNFRVLALKLKGKRKALVSSAKKFVLKKKHMTGSCLDLFDFIAGCIKTFMDEHDIDIGEKHNIGFTFSFPIKKSGIARGVLLCWTKGFCASGVEGKDVVKLLNESLKRKGLYNTKIAALANDTVSTLVARSYEDPNCDVGVILGTGTNACYPEGRMIINIEWGNFNKLRLTRFDKELDESSVNPGKQVLEKMVSGMYLGEVTRFVARDLIAKKILFGDRSSSVFDKPDGFKTEYMSVVEGDTTKNLSNINALLRKLGVSGSEYADRKLLKKICTVVSTRAARVSAAAIASVITKIDPHLSRKHTVAIDGSVYEKHPGFSTRMKSTLKEIFKRKAANIKLSLTKNASAKGAAIIAAV